MQLSLKADYALRVLLYLGTHPGEVVSTERISRAYGVSRHHLVRVVQTLGEHGYVQLLPGRKGGVTLARDPGFIRLGEVVRLAEPNLTLVECFELPSNTCPILGSCLLKKHLADALNAFLAELDRHTLAELLAGESGRRLTERFVQIG